MDVIVVSSDDEVEYVKRSPSSEWVDVGASTGYADALRDALAMVAAIPQHSKPLLNAGRVKEDIQLSSKQRKRKPTVEMRSTSTSVKKRSTTDKISTMSQELCRQAARGIGTVPHRNTYVVGAPFCKGVFSSRPIARSPLPQPSTVGHVAQKHGRPQATWKIKHNRLTNGHEQPLQHQANSKSSLPLIKAANDVRSVTSMPLSSASPLKDKVLHERPTKSSLSDTPSPLTSRAKKSEKTRYLSSSLPLSENKKRRVKRSLSTRFNEYQVPLEQIQAQDIEFARLRAEKQVLDTLTSVCHQSSDEPVDLCLSDECQPVLEIKNKSAVSSKKSTSSTSSTIISASTVSCLSDGSLITPWRLVLRRKWIGPPPTRVLVDAPRAFTDVMESPLTTYDVSGEIKKKCQYVVSIGSSTQLVNTSISQHLLHNTDQQQAVTTAHVRHVMESGIATIEKCFKRKTSILMKESRIRVRQYLDALNANRRISFDKYRSSLSLLKVSCPSRRAFITMPEYVIGYGDGRVIEHRLRVKPTLVEIPSIMSIPCSKTCIGMRLNVRVDDAPIARPSFSSRSPAATLPSAYSSVVGPTLSRPLLNPLDDEVAEHVLRYVIQECGDSESVFYGLKEVGFTQAYSDYCTLKKISDGRHMTVSRLDDAMKVRRTGKVHRLFDGCSHLKQAEDKTLTERLSPPPVFFNSYVVRDCTNNGSVTLGINPSNDYGKVVKSYRDLFCRICYQYDCSNHANTHPLPLRRVDPVYPSLHQWWTTNRGLMNPRHNDIDTRVEHCVPDGVVHDTTEYYDDSHVKLMSKKVALFVSSEQECSELCWKRTCNKGEIGELHTGYRLFNLTFRLLVVKLASVIGNVPCAIAHIIGGDVSCSLVQNVLKKHQSEGENHNGWTSDHLDQNRTRSRNGGLATSNRNALLRMQQSQDRAQDHAYKPCAHAGLCDSAGCGCIRRNHSCGKACSCARDCMNRYQGCKCGPGNCNDKCPCVSANRECDPDLCTGCGAAHFAMTEFEKFSRVPNHVPICPNTNLLRKAHKKVGISISAVHGWGGFALVPISEGEFICEYTGELISQDEAERRGRIYDKNQISYLFDVTEDTVVDAIRAGNKSRFFNHNAVQPNCVTKVTQVGTEHRISIWAKTDIKIGDEFVFDYGYKTANAPQWSQVDKTW